MKRTNNKNLASTTRYIDELFEHYSRLQILRIDLSYKKEHVDNVTLKDAKSDLKHLLNNRRSKPTIFSDCVGHIWKIEHTQNKGTHIHTILFYDGSKVKNDVYRALNVGEYWKGQITKERGSYFNCNGKKGKYKDCGIGEINHFDKDKRNTLREEVVSYLAKTEQSIDGIKTGHERSFGKGLAPKVKSKAGRPRKSE